MKDVLLFVVGVFVGGMNSIAGGGMLVGFPALLAAGLSPLTANVTGNLVVLPGQLTSAFGYRTYIKTLKRRYLLLLIPCLIGSAAGALVLSRTSSGEFERVVPGLITFAVVLFALQPYLHFHLHRHISRRSRNLQTLILIGIALLPIAFYGGYFGPGFGFIMLAFLGFTSLKGRAQNERPEESRGVSDWRGIDHLPAAYWTIQLALRLGNGYRQRSGWLQRVATVAAAIFAYHPYYRDRYRALRCYLSGFKV